MNKEQIERINQLAKKSKVEGLTEEEAKEQQTLRSTYLKEFRANMEAMLQNIDIKEADGTVHPLTKKPSKNN